MVLRDLPENAWAVIAGFAIELSESHRRRLVELGFAPGQRVRCARWVPFGGPRIYEVADGAFSLDADLSQAIEIQPAGEC
jgi:Fe2+ transport system protein FeoA